MIATHPQQSEKLVLTLPGGMTHAFTLGKQSITIGRVATNDIVLRDSLVSRNHARVDRSSHGYDVVDLGSSNGTRLNGVPVGRATLASGDVIEIGGSALRLELGEDAPDFDVTMIGEGKNLDALLMQTPLPTNLHETAMPRVAIHTTERTWEAHFPGDTLTIGRHASNTIVLDSSMVSRHHAVIEHQGNRFVLRDLKSTNGTFVAGQRVTSFALEDAASIEIGSARLIFKRGGADDEMTLVPTSRARKKKRPVVVVPGFAGSNLWRGSERIWPNPRMVLSHPDLLRIDQPLEARGVVNEVVIIPNLIRQDQYNSLTDYLKETLEYELDKDLLEFGYDFRQDNRESARRLAAEIDKWNVDGPITLIAHSMGCLVARYYVEWYGGKSKVERIIFLGAPHAGTPYAFASLLRGPDLLPLGLMNARFRDVIATFPSWYQILPTYDFASHQGTSFDVFGDDSWVSETSRPLLRNAREFRKELGPVSSVPSVCVFGYGLKTITAAHVERDELGGCSKSDFVMSPNGDGMIPESSALLERQEMHPVQQHHGSLFADNDVKMRLKLELTR